MKMKEICAVICVACLLFVTGLGSGKERGETGAKESFVATLDPPLNEPRPRQIGDTSDSVLSLTIKHTTSDDEMKGLVQTFTQGGQRALDKALGKAKKGYFKMGAGLTMPLVIVQIRAAGPNRRIQMVGKAPGQFQSPDGAATSSLPHEGFPYTFIQLDVDDQGNGRGMLVPFGNLGFDSDGHMAIKPMFRTGNSLLNVHLER